MSEKISFISPKNVYNIIKQTENKLIIVYLGVYWIQQLNLSMEAILSIKDDDVLTCIINEEEYLSYCTQEKILFGTGVLQLFYNSSALYFQIKDKTTTKWYSPLTKQIMKLIKQKAFEAIKSQNSTLQMDDLIEESKQEK
ncbi:hypothetical protein M0811_02839 [Anaeramoeba ignava]|uniref:Uncharacterized protein n=1 Tax=Anaeramoeba ignava TaxID=1746090 RepID=A0A9Q0L7S3_ANAIG|nr:hypothetical protein M0811_02839 [Anaeramoeba ignava]